MFFVSQTPLTQHTGDNVVCCYSLLRYIGAETWVICQWILTV